MLPDILNEEKIVQLRTHPYYKEMYKDAKLYADKICGKALNSLPYSKFKLYDEFGARWPYEERYFEHRKQLNALALCYVIFREEKYRAALEDIIWAICDEFTWALPAHMRGRSTKRKEVYLDLFSCETGMALAEILSMTASSLDTLVVERARKEIRRRIIESYFIDSFGWEKARNNWAAVCAGCVGMTFIYEAKAEEVESVMPRILDTMESFLDGYPEDGCCLEGLDYWDYGFGFYVYFAERLEKYYDGKYQLLKNEKVEKIAHYLQNVRVGSRFAASFSDAETRIMAFPGLIHFLHDFYGNVDIFPSDVLIKYGEDPTHRWAAFIRDYAWTDPNNLVSVSNDLAYYESAEWFIYNGVHYSFAAKAGHNNVPHNHNDVGSFIYCVEDKIVLTDPGKGEYTESYFSPNRYDFFVTSSRGHSVPIINGIYQKEGDEFKGKVLSYDEKNFCLEMAGAYGIDALISLKRCFHLVEDGIYVEDEFQFTEESGDVTERFILQEEPILKDDCIQIGFQNLTTEFSRYDITVNREDYRGSLGKMQSVYVLDFSLKQKEKHVTCTFRIAGHQGKL